MCLRRISPFFPIKNSVQRQVVIFLSGSGTNAQNVLEYWAKHKHEISYDVILFTDRPNESMARSIADKFKLPLIENDIKRFYQQQGCNRVTLATPVGRELREKWTNSVRNQLRQYNIDLGLFAGFVPLTNITAEFPCLNVHPGDLTYLKDGMRYLIGLHTIPIEKAILEGLSYLRSSVIVAQPYCDDKRDMDSGPIIGISEKIDIDFLGFSLEGLKKIAALRPPTRPSGGYQDDLELVAKFNQEKLKTQGDWVIFPRVAHEFAKGKFGIDDNGVLYYKNDDDWIQVKTIIFGKEKTRFIT